MTLVLSALAVLAPSPVAAQDPSPADTVNVDSLTSDSLAVLASSTGPDGPSSVIAQIDRDYLIPGFEFLRRTQRWLQRQLSLRVGADYSVNTQQISQSPQSTAAAGGAFRIYGTVAPWERWAPGVGAVVWKFEHRKSIATQLAPDELGPGAGYAGSTSPSFSINAWILSNLYWTQRFGDDRWIWEAGILGVTDYLDTYTLANPWTEFSNSAFRSGSGAMPAPGQGLGLTTRVRVVKNFYALAGIADANGDPSRPDEAWSSFFDTKEYFWHAEMGWATSWDRFADNVHVSAWKVDERSAPGIEGGWGLAASASPNLFARLTAFLRGAYSSGGGAPLERSVSAGVGYLMGSPGDRVAVAVNWGRPNTEITGGEVRDQYTLETYYKAILVPRVEIWPSLQFFFNPALLPDGTFPSGGGTLWLVSVRGRVSF